VIELRGVTLTYPNGTRALDDIDLEIGKADFVFLVGHSGTGKSSLLKLLYREATPDSGEVMVDGIRVDKLRRGKVAKLRRDIGVVFQDFMLPSELSGGEQQRAAIARALVNNPKILLCDEPTGNLDPSNTTEIIELLQRINLKGTTVLVATHNQAVVDRMRRRVVRLENGRILHDDERGYYFRGLGQSPVLSG
jgi:cell division transport system ATP-binding protein